MIPSSAVSQDPLIPSPILPSITSLHPWFICNFPALKSELALVQFVSKIPPSQLKRFFSNNKTWDISQGKTPMLLSNHLYFPIFWRASGVLRGLVPYVVLTFVFCFQSCQLEMRAKTLPQIWLKFALNIPTINCSVEHQWSRKLRYQNY